MLLFRGLTCALRAAGGITGFSSAPPPKVPCPPLPTPSTQCPDGCKVCTADGACSACDSNYALVGGKCKPCEDSKAATCSADDLGVSEACAVSAGGLKDGKCVDCKDEVMRQGILFFAFCD